MINSVDLYNRDLDRLGASGFAAWLSDHYVNRKYDPIYFWFDREHPFDDVLISIWPKLSESSRQIASLGLQIAIGRLHRMSTAAAQPRPPIDVVHPLAAIAFATDQRQCAPPLYDLAKRVQFSPESEPDVILFGEMLNGLLSWLKEDLEGLSATDRRRLIDDDNGLRELSYHCHGLLEDRRSRANLAPILDKLLFFVLLDVFFPIGTLVATIYVPSGPRSERARRLVEAVIDDFNGFQRVHGPTIYQYQEPVGNVPYDLDAMRRDIQRFCDLLSVTFEFASQLALQPAILGAHFLDMTTAYFLGDSDKLARSRAELNNPVASATRAPTPSSAAQMTCEELFNEQFL